MKTAHAWAGACVVCSGWLGSALAQPGIYTCVDARGKRITSDRPIAECIDRAQKELNPSGTLRRNVGPSLTAQERAQEEEREKRAAEEQSRLNEERRRNRALLARYQDVAAHDRERANALSQIDAVLAAAAKRMADLDKERAGLVTELEFYQGELDKAPPKVRRQVEENESNVAAQKRFMNDQENERSRVNARFDEELARLRQLWADRVQPQPARSR